MKQIDLLFLALLVTCTVIGAQQCNDPIQLQDPQDHRVYRLGVLAIRGVETAFKDFNATAEYLTHAVGPKFDPPISVEIAPVAFGNGSVIDKFESGHYDFVFANPSISSCVDSEIGTNSLVSMIAKRKVGGNIYKLTRFGGVIFTRANNTEINSIHDIENKSTACVSITGLGSGQMQFRELQQAGLHHLQDPKQVLFMQNQVNVVHGVLNGQVDVGYVRTDQLERTKNRATGELVDLSLLKIIDPRPGLEIGGVPFPFQSSSSLYPEWNIAALNQVPDEVAQEVQASLLQMSSHASIAPALLDCYDDFGCEDTACYDACYSQLDRSSFQNCDTTSELGVLAHYAMLQGRNAGWRSTLSYLELRNMQEETGFIGFNSELKSVRCSRSSELADAVVCPEGHYKKSNAEIENGCSDLGIPCYGFQCLCQPCVRSFDVSFFPFKVDGRLKPENVGCEKFTVCGQVEQMGSASFRAVDNKRRRNGKASALVKIGEIVKRFDMAMIDNSENVVHEFVFEAFELPSTIGIMEVFINGEAIPESPFQFEIIPRDCVAATGDKRRHPNTRGDCVCDSWTSAVNGRCIPFSVVFPSVVIPLGIFLSLALYFYIKRKREKEDNVWRIDPTELTFRDPPTVLGAGSFGMVLVGEYRGTQVAVKRALPQSSKKTHSAKPPRGRTRSSSFRSMASSSFSDMGGDVFTYADLLCGERDDYFDPSTYPEGIAENQFISRRSLAREVSSWIYSSVSADVFAISKFHEEIRRLSKLRHPCITTVLGAITNDLASPILVMEHMELGSLYDLLHDESLMLEGDTVISIVGDVARGLRFLHEANPPVLHCDLKAKNILVSSQFQAKISDFGLSQTRGKRGNFVAGTSYWMAPELILGKSANTCESDIYSMGILLYEVFSRKAPFHGMNADEVLPQVCDTSINLRPPIPHTCPERVASIMRLCFSANPNDRPSAAEIDEEFKMNHLDSAGRTEALLSDLFPSNVAAALRDGRKVEPELHECVTVYFSDIVDYTELASDLSPTKVSSLLDRLYTKFDRLCTLHDIFKVETVGDAYMTVTGLTSDQPDHATAMAYFALDAVQAAATTLIDEDDPAKGPVEIRVGFHSGKVASHVVGLKNPRYSIIGDTVNIAARMESNSRAGLIQCTEASAKLIGDCPDFKVTSRGNIQVKGKGEIFTYWVQALDDEGIDGDGSSGIDIEGRDRLIERNVSLLETYLKKIVAFRKSATDTEAKKQTLSVATSSFKAGATVIDEVVDIIALPKYNAKISHQMKAYANMELPNSVRKQLLDFVSNIAGMYRDENEFHNFKHASHVALSIDKLLTSVVSPKELEQVDERRREYTISEYTYGISNDPLVHFAVIFAALIHDVDHSGVSNAQLVKEKHTLATTYKGKSVAEQNSIDLAWSLLMSQKYKGLRETIAKDASEMARFRQVCVNAVMATDIVDKELKKNRNQRWEVAFSDKAMEINPGDNLHRKATIVVEHLIQASDISHTMQHWHVYRRWNERFFQECYSAYENGRAESDPSENWYKGELGFFDFYIIPLTKKLKDCGVFGASSSEYLEFALRNRAEWEVRGKHLVAEMVERVKSRKKKPALVRQVSI